MKNIKNKPVSTFDRMMKNEDFRKQFEPGYKEFLISELFLALKEEDDNEDVKKLAREIGICTENLNAESIKKKAMEILDKLNYEKTKENL